MTTSRTRVALGWLMLSLLASALPARAMCPAPQYYVTLRTPTDQPLPPELPLLLVVSMDRTGTQVYTSDGAIAPPSLRVTGGDDFAQDLAGELVGPGLVAYHAEPSLAPGAYQVEGLSAPVSVTVAARALPPLAAPQVSSVVHRERESEGRYGGRTWTDRITLGAPLPREAVALVFALDGSRAQLDIPSSALASAARELEIGGSMGGHCGGDRPPGDYRLAGRSARASLVDQWGRVAVAGSDVSIAQEGALSRASSGGASPHTSRCDAVVSAQGSLASPLLTALATLALVTWRRRSAHARRAAR
ncbi:MAG: hypothetical protein R3B40_30000 [Polyangiales bacterium]|nr:hypothetical protein [Sandaracinaceae bacterium]